MAKIGTIIGGKYKVLEQIGKGGMAKVYRAIDIHLQKEWAIKEVVKKAENEYDRVYIQSAIAEADMLKKLDHPSIPRVVDIIDEKECIYIVMDFIAGDTLEQLLEREGMFSVNEVMEWAKALCEVLDYLHGQNPPIIYRDMKPGNVIVTANGNLKLIDFGIAREYKECGVMDTVSLGTRGYAAPEQLAGTGQTDRRTDIYNLGVTCYRLLTGVKAGKIPEHLASIRQLRPELPEGVEYIIAKCTQQNPNARYQNCKELLRDLENYEQIDSRGKSKEFRKNKRKEWFLGLGGLLLALILLAEISFLKKEYTDTGTYNSSMLRAEHATTSEEKIAHYLDAIAARPGEWDPYAGLITLMESDEVFEVSEELILRQQVEYNLHVLRKQANYAKLAFEIGEIYRKYYAYGKTEQTDNAMTRIKSALFWFQEACQYGDEADEFYESAQRYCELGNYAEELIHKPLFAADWNDYEMYSGEIQKRMSTPLEETGVERGWQFVTESVYMFDDSLTKLLGEYVSEEMSVKVTELNRSPLQVDKMRVFLEKNGVARELVREQEYTVSEVEKVGEWYAYEYCVQDSVFAEEGSYEIALFSVDEEGNVNQNTHGMKTIEIVFGIDKTAPNIIPLNTAGAKDEWTIKGIQSKTEIEVMVEDNMILECVEAYVDGEACTVTEAGNKFTFEVEKTDKEQTIIVVARDVAGNEAIAKYWEE